MTTLGRPGEPGATRCTTWNFLYNVIVCPHDWSLEGHFVWAKMLTVSSFLILSLVTPLTKAIFAPIGTSKPTPPGGSVASDAPPTSFFQGFDGPKPTNDWWVGFGAQPKGDEYASPHSTCNDLCPLTWFFQSCCWTVSIPKQINQRLGPIWPFRDSWIRWYFYKTERTD